MLLLLLNIQAVRCAIRATDIVEVVPAVPLAPVAKPPPFCLGGLDYHGRAVSVYDLAHYFFGRNSHITLSTRIVIVAANACRTQSRIGMLAESVTETVVGQTNDVVELADPTFAGLEAARRDAEVTRYVVLPIAMLVERLIRRAHPS